jgi:hypothetical protein
VSHFAPAASVDRSAAVNATAPDRDTAAIDRATTIIAGATRRIGIIAARLPIATVGDASAAIDTAPIDGAASIDPTTTIDPATTVNPAPSIDGSTPVGAAPASDCRHQRTSNSGIGEDRFRLHDRGDGLRWLRYK